jgi:CRP-like cAMP-binding protein
MAQTNDRPLDLRAYLAKARGGTAKEYRKKQNIFAQGSPADAVFYVEKGKVKLTVLSTRGKEAVVAILGSGDFFGEGSLAGQPLRMATATAMTECSILRVQKETMVRRFHCRTTLGWTSSSRETSARVFSPFSSYCTTPRLNSTVKTRRPSDFWGNSPMRPSRPAAAG